MTKNYINMIKLNNFVYNFFEAYIESRRRESYKPFPMAYYNANNTMFEVHNDFPKFLLSLSSYSTVKVCLRCIDLLKHLNDPSLGCSIMISHDKFKDLASKNRYHIAIRELIKLNFLINTPVKKIKIVNINMAHKLPKPKINYDDITKS